MKERAAELRAQAKRAKGAAKAEAELNDLLERSRSFLTRATARSPRRCTR